MKKSLRFILKNIKKVFTKWNNFFKYRVHPLENFIDSPDYFETYRFFNKNPEMQRWKGGWIYKGRKYPDYLFMGGAAFAIFNKAKKLLDGNGVDIGAGYWTYPGAVSIDTQRGEGFSNSINDFEDGSLDYIFSSHCLEHILNWKKELKHWKKKLKIGGLLFLYLPHSDCEIWHSGAPGIGKGHKWIPNCEIILKYLSSIKMEVKYLDKGPDSMMSFSICAEKLIK